MEQNYDTCFALEMKNEGGYVNDPRDPGGATNFGVTIGTLRALNIDVDRDGDVDVDDVKKLTLPMVSNIMRTKYWNAVKAGQVQVGIDYLLFDAAIQHGPLSSVKFLQRALNVADDGHIGPVTLDAANRADPESLIGRMIIERRKHMQSKPTWATYKKGFENRLIRIQGQATTMAVRGIHRTSPVPAGKSGSGFARWLASLLAAIFGKGK